MNKQELFENIKRKESFLCVGLDTDIQKIPSHLLKEEDPVFAFNKAIIDATAPYCIAYKPNLAFYESMGVKGWLAFEKTIQYLNKNYSDQFIIADAKRGWVSWLVIALTAGCIGVEFCMYPSLRQGLSRFEQRMARRLPIAILPLLVLMTIGIARRFNDYGITLNRLYLLTLNIWFYIVCIGLFVLRARRIQWIAVSFAGIFLLTSVLPVNYARLTHRYMFQALSIQIQTSYKGELPMDEEQYLDWLASLPRETARLTNSRLKILDYTFKDKEIHRLVAPDINYWGAEKCIKENSEVHFSQKENGAEVIAKGTYLHFEASSPSSVKMELNTGYSELVAYHKSEDFIPCKYWKEEVMPIELTDGHQVIDTIYVQPSDIRKWSAMDTIPPQKFIGRQKDNLFILTDFSLSGYAGDKNLNFTYSGYYFIQKKTN